MHKTYLVVLFLAAAVPLTSTAQVKVPDQQPLPVEVTNFPLAQTISGRVSVVGEVELQNERGDSLSVRVDNRDPIEVVERPGNSTYLKSVGTAGSRSITIPVRSHLLGVTVSVRPNSTSFTDGPDACFVRFLYPFDPAQRPQFSDQTFFFMYLRPYTTQYVPMPNLFVGEDVDLQIEVRDEFGTDMCVLSATLMLRALPQPLTPQ